MACDILSFAKRFLVSVDVSFDEYSNGNPLLSESSSIPSKFGVDFAERNIQNIIITNTQSNVCIKNITNSILDTFFKYFPENK